MNELEPMPGTFRKGQLRRITALNQPTALAQGAAAGSEQPPQRHRDKYRPDRQAYQPNRLPPVRRVCFWNGARTHSRLD